MPPANVKCYSCGRAPVFRKREEKWYCSLSCIPRNLGSSRPARRIVVPPCPCPCNSGGFCGGCGHAGCGGR